MNGVERGIQEEARGAGLRPVGEGDAAPVVFVDPDLSITARRLGEIAGRLDVFDLGGDLVWIDHLGRIRPMGVRTFRTWINQWVLIARGADKDDKPKRGTLEQQESGAVIDSPVFLRGVRELRGLNKVRLPALGDEGELRLLEEGYDDRAGVYTLPGAIEYDTEWTLEQALAWLRRVFGEFPMASNRSLAVQLAAFMAMYCRHILTAGVLRPGFLWLANKAGSGKSVMAKAVLYAVEGRASAAKLKRGQELDKELEAFSRGRSPYIFFDNVYGELKSAAIDQLLTSRSSTGRAMGGHGIFDAENDALLMVTGNRIELNEDAARRFLVVDLFEEGQPGDRVITHRLSDNVMSCDVWRANALAALYAFVRHWWAEGMPRGPSSMATYEEFSEVVGGIVAAAGLGDPMEPPEIPDAINVERNEFRELVDRMALRMIREWRERREEDGLPAEPLPPQMVAKFSLEDFTVEARAGELFVDKLGTVEDGQRLVAKLDKIPGEMLGSVCDRGYVDRPMRGFLGALFGGKIGGHERVSVGTFYLGSRDESRKRGYSCRLELR